MRPAPNAPPGLNRTPFECRMRFHRPLRRVELVPADAVAPAVRPAPSAPRLEPEPTRSAPPATQPPTNTAPPAPTDHWPIETERELTLDRERIETVLREVRAAVTGLRQDHEGRLQELQRVAVELALTIATRLLHERVAAGDFPIDAKVRDMIAQLGEDVPVVVRLNPADLELLKGRLGGEPLSADRDDPRFLPDPALARGACQVEGRESMLLSDVTRELHDIRDDLLRSLDNARS